MGEGVDGAIASQIQSLRPKLSQVRSPDGCRGRVSCSLPTPVRVPSPLVHVISSGSNLGVGGHRTGDSLGVVADEPGRHIVVLVGGCPRGQCLQEAHSELLELCLSGQSAVRLGGRHQLDGVTLGEQAIETLDLGDDVVLKILDCRQADIHADVDFHQTIVLGAVAVHDPRDPDGINPCALHDTPLVVDG